MLSRINRLLSLLCTLALAACANTSLESQVKSGYDKKIETLLVVYDSSDAAAEAYYQNTGSLLKSMLEQHQVKSDFHVTSPLALDNESAIKEKVRSLAPRHLLTVSQSSANVLVGKPSLFGSGPKPVTVGGVFNLVLQEADGRTEVWRARMETRGYGGSFSGTGSPGFPQSTAESIIAQLQKDGLIK